MRKTASGPTADPLPYGLGVAPGAGATPPLLPGTAAIAGFNALLHEINPDAARADADRLQHLMQWLLGLPENEARAVLDRRLQRAEQLRAMLDDADWVADESLRARVARLLGYIDRDDDLIADREPLFGLLDDVLLIELAWPAFADEADDYQDFCLYRDLQHPPGDGEQKRAAWIRDRLAEIALQRHQAQASESRYAPSGGSGGRFRVD